LVIGERGKKSSAVPVGRGNKTTIKGGKKLTQNRGGLQIGTPGGAPSKMRQIFGKVKRLNNVSLSKRGHHRLGVSTLIVHQKYSHKTLVDRNKEKTLLTRDTKRLVKDCYA